MKASLCPPHHGGEIYFCDVCGLVQSRWPFAYINDRNACVCESCVDLLTEWIDMVRSASSDAEKNGIKNIIPKHASMREPRERAIENQICSLLQKAGIEFRRQVRCEIGIADVVTEDAVIEVKAAVLTRREFHQAAGQALAYAEALGKKRSFVASGVIGGPLVGATAFGVRIAEHEEIVTFISEG